MFEHTGKEKVNVFQRLSQELKVIHKPTPKELWHGTWVTMLIAFCAAVSISAVDSVFTSLMRVFF